MPNRVRSFPGDRVYDAMQPLHIVSLVNRYRPNDALNVRNIRISFGFNLSMYGVFKVTEMLVYVSPVRTFSQMIQDT